LHRFCDGFAPVLRECRVGIAAARRGRRIRCLRKRRIATMQSLDIERVPARFGAGFRLPTRRAERKRIEPMTGRFHIAAHPTQSGPKPGIAVCAGRIAGGDVAVMPMQRSTLGAVRRDGSSAT
jgi:hypothetical protein